MSDANAIPAGAIGPYRLILTGIAALAAFFSPTVPTAQVLIHMDGTAVELVGEMIGSEDISAIARVHDVLVIGSDEAIGDDKNENYIQVFKPDGDKRFVRAHDIRIHKADADKREMDIEALAAMEDVVYVLGSHSRNRSRIREKHKYKRNRKTFRSDAIKKEKSRSHIYRLAITSEGTLRPDGKSRQNLREVIDRDPVLGIFAQIPGKENGVDIEGLAADGPLLYAGFRGPVLRGGHVPVMRFAFDDPAGTYSLLYVNLDGRGVRSLARVSDGFLILAGPLNNGPGSFRLYHWDGKDMIPGDGRADQKVGKTRLLRELAVPASGKPEGLVVMAETDAQYDLILVLDGIAGAAPRRHRIAKY